jgi:hypothetical protein
VIRKIATLGGLLLAAACSGNGADSDESPDGAAIDRLPYARDVVSFAPGDFAGFGADRLPDVVLGPPGGEGQGSGSLDVLSLGVGGEIVLGFGERIIEDGPGPDFVVFENPFYPEGDPARVFAEPAAVAVSDDGDAFLEYDCDAAGDGNGHFTGCAGVTPTEPYDPFRVDPIDPELTGGDSFDLAELGLTEARFVRLVDRAEEGTGTTAGFDLDSVGLIHFR